MRLTFNLCGSNVLHFKVTNKVLVNVVLFLQHYLQRKTMMT